MAAPITQKDANATEIRSGDRQVEYAECAHVGEFCASQVPSRAIIRLMPKAKLNSFPRNHLAMAVVTAMISDSAPSPKISRLGAITASLHARTVTMEPMKHSVPKMKIALRVPMRSTM